MDVSLPGSRVFMSHHFALGDRTHISLQTKILAVVAVIFLVTLGASTWYSATSQHRQLLAAATDQTLALVDSCFDSLNVMMLTGNMEGREVITRRLAAEPQVVEARFIRGAAVDQEYGEGEEGEAAVDELDRRGLAGEEIATTRNGSGGLSLTVIRPWRATHATQGIDCLNCHDVEEGTVLGAVRIGYSLAAVQAAFVATLTRTVAINLALFAAGMVLAGLFVRRTIARPLRRMAATAREIAAGHLDQEVTHRSTDEIGTLADAFREMVSYLNNMAAGADAFARGDLSHEVAVHDGDDRLATAIGRLRTTMRAVLAESSSLLAAAQEGDFGRRGNGGKFEGAYRELIDGFNETIDTTVAPVNEAVTVLERLADGDLAVRMSGDYRGDHARIKEAFNRTTAELAVLVSEVVARSEEVGRAAEEIAASNRDLADRIEEEASSLEETAAAVEEVTTTVEQNADHADRANTLAEEAAGSADEGAIVVCEAVGAVGEIEESSTRIQEIIEVIDEIAFQTNLLSLNAAVEAARAGEQGRGFAVVAAEVRNLARRSAKAAEEIKVLITESVSRVNTGNDLVMETGVSLANIRGSVREVTATVVQIADATREQATGIGSVNQVVQRMNGMTRSNAAAVEEVARKAHRLRDLTGAMRSELGRLKV